MIDEELYVLATQELNSDGRRDDLWARAIALASDDHDEARYLYTNLRVEELVKERKTAPLGGKASKPTPEEPSSVAGSPKIGENPKTEGMGFEGLTADVAKDDYTAPSDVSRMQQKAEELNHELRGKQRGYDTNDTAKLDAGDGFEALVDSDSTLETEPLPESPPLIIADTDSLDRTEPEGFGLNDSSLDLTSPDNLPPVQISPDPYQPLGRGARDNDQSQYGDDTASHYSDANYLTEDANQDAIQGANLDATQDTTQGALGDAVHYNNENRPNEEVPPVFDEELPTETIDRFDQTIEPVLHSGRAFNVLKHSDGSRKAIRMGNSWTAMFFTFPWLIYKKLWGTALVYLVMGAVLLFGVVSTGLNWLGAGADATLQQKLIFGAFALLALFGMLYLPFRQGNQWVVKRLNRKGYNDHAKINAQTAKDAIDLARE